MKKSDIKSPQDFLEYLHTTPLEELDEMQLQMLYKEKFDDLFPSMTYQDDIKSGIIECIKSGKPFESKVPKGAIL